MADVRRDGKTRISNLLDPGTKIENSSGTEPWFAFNFAARGFEIKNPYRTPSRISIVS